MADDNETVGGGDEQPSLPPVPVPGIGYTSTYGAAGYPTVYNIPPGATYNWTVGNTGAAQPWGSTVVNPVFTNTFYPSYSAVETAPGWVCPGCGQGYSPLIAACWHCVPKPPAPEEESGETPPAEE